MDEYLLNRSFMNALKNKITTKLADMKQLLELKPGNQKYHYDLGQVYMALEDYEAATSFQNAQGSPYRNLEEDAKFSLGTTKLAQSQIDPAIDLFKEIIKTNPDIAARKNLEMALALKQMQPQQEQQNQEAKSTRRK